MRCRDIVGCPRLQTVNRIDRVIAVSGYSGRSLAHFAHHGGSPTHGGKIDFPDISVFVAGPEFAVAAGELGFEEEDNLLRGPREVVLDPAGCRSDPLADEEVDGVLVIRFYRESVAVEGGSILGRARRFVPFSLFRKGPSLGDPGSLGDVLQMDVAAPVVGHSLDLNPVFGG